MKIDLINPDNPTNAANIPFLQKELLSWNATGFRVTNSYLNLRFTLNARQVSGTTPPPAMGSKTRSSSWVK